jgi:hypothetical protein
MGPDITPPRFLSLEFHTRFFPQLLRDRLRLKRREEQGTSFVSTMEMMVTVAVCLILAAVGIPLALNRGSAIGWILGVLGVGGMSALLISSVASHWGDRPTYHDFLTGIFLFFVSVGVFIGIPVGMGKRSPWLGVLTSLAGLLAGYGLGIFAGLRLQHLGWIAGLINMMAGFAAVVTGGAFLIMLLVLTIG